MNRSDLAAGLVFLAIGLFLIGGSLRLPAGFGGLPGPGFFPGIVGGVMAALALGLLLSSRRRGAAVQPDISTHNARTLCAVAGLLFLYLLLWGIVPFALRTPVFVVLLLRMLGEAWKPSLAVAGVLTLGTMAAFQFGLRVPLQ